MKRYSGLDVLKFVAAFGIVGCHLGIGDKTEGANVAMRLTDMNVGIFAAISGFFVANGLNKNESLRVALRKRVVRLLPIYLMWSGIYLTASTLIARHFDRLLDFQYLIGVIVRGGAACHLWYLIALLYFSILVLFLSRFSPTMMQNKFFLSGAIALWLWVATLGDYTFWFGYYFGRLVAFSLFGMLLYGLREKLVRLPWIVWVGIGLAGVLFRLCCDGLAHKFILDAIGTIAILPMFVNWPWRMERLGSKLASLSLGVYLIHPLFAAVVAIIARRYLSVPVDLWGMMTMWFAVWGAAIVIALFMGRIPVVRRFV